MSVKLKKKYRHKGVEIKIEVLLGYDTQFKTAYKDDSDTPILLHAVTGYVASVAVFKRHACLSTTLHEDVELAKRECQNHIDVAHDVEGLVKILIAEGFFKQ